MSTVYEIYRLTGPLCIGACVGPPKYEDLTLAAQQADGLMRKRGWFAVGVRPEGSPLGRWSYLNTRDDDPPKVPAGPPPPPWPLPMRDNPVAVPAA